VTDSPSTTLEAAKTFFVRGLEAHQAGDLAEAERAFREALALTPDRPSVLTNLGLVLLQAQKFEEAEAILHKKAAVESNSAASLLALGDCLMLRDKHQDALACYVNAAEREADSPLAHSRAGRALLTLGRHAEALARFERALALEPQNTFFLLNRGNILFAQDDYAAALAAYDALLAADPHHPDALRNRAVVLIKLLRYDDAIASLRALLALEPDHPDARIDLARVFLRTKNPREALTAIDPLLAQHPGHVHACTIRGDALLALGRAAEALAAFDLALAHQAEDPDLLNSRCDALLRLDQPQVLVESYERLLRANHGYDYAAGCLLHAKLYCCDWRGYDDAVKTVSEAVRAGRRADLPFTFLAVSGSAADQLQCARLHAAHEHPAPAEPLWRGEIYGHDKIRVAYLSADFHEHATAHLMAGLFEAHDQSRFEVTAISFGPDTGDAMRGRLKRAFSRFVDVQNLGDYQVAARLRALQIDIAVDLKGYTQDHRAGILAYRPAPVQVNYLGYPGTMGADFIDYIIADAVVIPPQDRAHYAEQVVTLPDSYQVNDAARAISPYTLARAAADLPQTGIVLCCFNNHYKITPQVFDIWMRILAQVKGSVLWLLAGHDVAMRNLRLEAQRRGVAPERLVFAPRMTLDQHLARHRLADIFVDTLPYNAHTTASDALWAGLPVVTCAGQTFAGRVAASLLTAAEMPELICDTADAYEALILELAANRDLLAKTKARLAHHRTACPCSTPTAIDGTSRRLIQ
jgi:protein O-GlcNAc transferase